MRKTLLRWGIALAAAAVLMVALPLLVPKNTPAAMTVVMVLWYIVNPLFCLAAGIFAGLYFREMWPLPILPPLLFLLGMAVSFDLSPAEPLPLALSYLGFGVIAMLVTALIRYRNAHRE